MGSMIIWRLSIFVWGGLTTEGGMANKWICLVDSHRYAAYAWLDLDRVSRLVYNTYLVVSQ